jgi:hypothetical protein
MTVTSAVWNCGTAAVWRNRKEIFSGGNLRGDFQKAFRVTFPPIVHGNAIAGVPVLRPLDR